ncbi:MAG TPA: hypothetical protein VFV79_05290, partial [Saprospiraceae bacterium]|nr:hypothetical protein [Saprospiraceae bacterium]
MNTTNTFIFALLLSFAMPIIYTRQATPLHLNSIQSNDTLWYEKGVDWLLASQSKDGGWGSGSFAYLTDNNFPEAMPDPATTAFVAMALLEAGGRLNTNPYHKEINHAVEYIIKTIDTRPENGTITSQTNTQPQRKLGMNIDASMALDFLVKVRSQMEDTMFIKKIDAAALICIDLLKGHQNPDGTFRNGGWAGQLHNSNINASLTRASSLYPAADSIVSPKSDPPVTGLSSIDGGDIHIRGSRTSASDYYTDGIRATSVGSAGIALYDAVSIESETDEDATEAKMYLSEVVVTEYK